MLCISCKRFLSHPPHVWPDTSLPVPQHSLTTDIDDSISNAVTPEVNGFLFHETLSYVQVSAAQFRCHLCTLVWSRLRRNFSADELGPDLIATALRDGSYASNRSPQVRIYVRQVRHSDSYIYLCIEVALKEESQGIRDFLPIVTKFTANLENVARSLSSSTSDDTPFATAVEWLSCCQTQHEECFSHVDFLKVVPARLIDVSEGFHGKNSVRLCSTNNNEKYEYLTLSHRWGDSSRLRLTEELLSEFFKGIAVERLAKTFRDAITITRRLGFSYLWIDCLCILQDSPQDWATESAKMAGIYGNGVCNIAAAASSNSDGGCFMERNPFEILPLRAQYNADYKVHKSLIGGVYIFGDNVENTWEEVGGALSDRGWILQETLLAPRTLYYGRQQLYWECRSTRACEIWPKGDQTHGRMWSGTDVKEKSTFDIEHLREEEEDLGWVESDPELLYARWASLVEIYSVKSLSYASDKLIAISGLADMFKSRLGDQYLAGLWRGNFLRGLTWRTLSYRMAHRQGSMELDFRAPTWSWASIDGVIQYPPPQPELLTMCAHIVQVEASPADGSQTGRVRHASLRIVGLMKTANWVPTFAGQYGMHLVCLGHPNDRDLLMRLYPDTGLDALETTVHCLQLGRQSRGHSRRVFGLVLVPSGKQDGEYRRVGSFQTPGSHHNNVLKDEDWSAFEEGWSEKAIKGYTIMKGSAADGAELEGATRGAFQHLSIMNNPAFYAELPRPVEGSETCMNVPVELWMWDNSRLR